MPTITSRDMRRVILEQSKRANVGYLAAVHQQEADLKRLVDQGRLELLYGDRAFSVLRIRDREEASRS